MLSQMYSYISMVSLLVLFTVVFSIALFYSPPTTINVDRAIQRAASVFSFFPALFNIYTLKKIDRYSLYLSKYNNKIISYVSINITRCY